MMKNINKTKNSDVTTVNKIDSSTDIEIREDLRIILISIYLNKNIKLS